MPLIKRYNNRKLYDTEARQYITLEGVAGMIRQGRPVSVIDNVSGDDLTAITLTQIILEQEKKQSGTLPHSLLAKLIQDGSDLFEALQAPISETDLEKALTDRQLMTHQDLQRLTEQLEALSVRLDQLKQSG